jgi:hypothetical protein
MKDFSFPVQSFIFSGARALSAPVGEGPGSVVVSISRGGEGSEQLKQWHSRATVIPAVTLSNGKRGSAYLEFRLYSVKVTSYSLSGQDNTAIEEISIVYERIEWSK